MRRMRKEKEVILTVIRGKLQNMEHVMEGEKYCKYWKLFRRRKSEERHSREGDENLCWRTMDRGLEST